MKQAYGITALNNEITQFPQYTNTGKGQTIVLIDPYDPTLAADVAVHDTTYHLPAVNLTINFAAGSPPQFFNPGNATETALDVEWAHSIAPGANIICEVANSLSITDIAQAIQGGITALGTSGGVMSMSLGVDEDPLIFSVFDPLFNNPTQDEHISFLASTGDTAGQLSLPALDPNVTAVGGTTLNIDAKGNRISETTWGKESDGSGGGGGVSKFIPVPSYQQGLTIYGEPPAANRAGPDISMDANPATGVPVYDTTGMSGWGTVGGTSLSSPMFAGIVALANELRAVSGNKATGSNLTIGSALNSTLYNLFKINPTQDFYDVTTAEQGITPAYPVGPGYDLDTGIGTPIGNTLIPSLAGYIPPNPSFQFGGAHFIQSLSEPLPSAPLDDPRAVTNFFGGGNIVVNPKKVDLTIGILSDDGTNTTDSANMVINPLKRMGANLDTLRGTGTATLNVDNNTFTFPLEFRGTITREHKVNYVKGVWFTVNAAGQELEQGPDYVYEGTYQGSD